MGNGLFFRALLMRALFFVLYVLVGLYPVFGQGEPAGISSLREVVEPLNVPLERIAGVDERWSSAGGVRGTRAPLSVPFYDDFSYVGEDPDASFWEAGSHVRVQRHEVCNPPTPGVAVFDAMLSDGMPPASTTGGAYSPDTLTSKPFRFDRLDDTTIYLSFRYQGGGLADFPGDGDSLSLDFYIPGLDRWVPAWSVQYEGRERRLVERFHLRYLSGREAVEHRGEGLGCKFFSVHLPVRGGDFLAEGFRFRFRGRSSVEYHRDTPGRSTSSRRWFLDMVYLDRMRFYNDSSVNDVTCYAFDPVLVEGYSTVPLDALRHYVQGREGKLFESLAFRYCNLTDRWQNVARSFQILDRSGGLAKREYASGHENLKRFDSVRCERQIDYDLAGLLSGDELDLELRGVLANEVDPGRWMFRYNDTIRQRLYYKDEYGYDSGRPDLGYGIVGIGADRASVGVQFKPVGPDGMVVRAVRIWYNRLLDPSVRSDQRLVIWDGTGGRPGRELYAQSFSVPHDNGELGCFVTVPLEEALHFRGPVFVGWRQSTLDFVNVGVDMSVQDPPVTYYRSRGGWLPSRIAGAVMVRLVCGGSGREVEQGDGEEHQGLGSEEGAVETVRVYPNPASGYFSVDWPGRPLGGAIHRVCLYDGLGRVVRVYEAGLGGEALLSLSGISAGVYVVRVEVVGGEVGIGRLVVRP